MLKGRVSFQRSGSLEGSLSCILGMMGLSELVQSERRQVTTKDQWSRCPLLPAD